LRAKVSGETLGKKSSGKDPKGLAKNKRYENFMIRLIRDLSQKGDARFSIARRRARGAQANTAQLGQSRCWRDVFLLFSGKSRRAYLITGSVCPEKLCLLQRNWIKHADDNAKCISTKSENSTQEAHFSYKIHASNFNLRELTNIRQGLKL